MYTQTQVSNFNQDISNTCKYISNNYFIYLYSLCICREKKYYVYWNK